jgi:hypothetical protein
MYDTGTFLNIGGKAGLNKVFPKRRGSHTLSCFQLVDTGLASGCPDVAVPPFNLQLLQTFFCSIVFFLTLLHILHHIEHV